MNAYKVKLSVTCTAEKIVAAESEHDAVIQATQGLDSCELEIEDADYDEIDCLGEAAEYKKAMEL